MKKNFLLFLALFFCSLPLYAADLLDVYQQAVTSDPTFQQALAQRMYTREGVPISLSELLPNVALSIVPSVSKSIYSGQTTQPTNTALQLAYTLTITQTVLNLAQFADVAESLANASGADATLNAATQSLMVRAANAYFAVLKDEENLRYSAASKRAFAQQLDQARQQYNVGLKTLTDVYTAQASYDSATASYIAAQTTLDNDRENLRAITGKYYPQLATLSDTFPFVTPSPSDIEQWVAVSRRQNWSIKAAQYAVDNAIYNIKQQFAGHFPTINLEGSISRTVTNNINSGTGAQQIVLKSGSVDEVNRTIELNINVPIFEGGQVVAQTNQATYNYQITEQKLEFQVRSTETTARQSYLGIISGISKIEADKQTIKSTISSLQGLEASYQVGTETLVDVLNQQQNVYQAQTQYAADRYAYINNLLALKQAAGTLNFDDLRAINSWLIETNTSRDTYSYRIIKRHHVRLHKKHSA